jgi:alpha-L-rhamnosidase
VFFLQIFRREFKINKEIKLARLYCTSLGLYEFYINGDKVGSDLFTPGWTSFEKRLQFQVSDISDMLTRGENAASIMLGNDWYRSFGPNSKQNNKIDLEAIAQVEIEFFDGTKQILKTDKSWKSSTGAILKSEIYDGEIYDARLEQPRWRKPRFNDEGWKGVIVTKINKDNLVSAISELVKRIEEITPVEII